MSLPSTLISAKALSLLLACASLYGLASPQTGLASTAPPAGSDTSSDGADPDNTNSGSTATVPQQTWISSRDVRIDKVFSIWYNDLSKSPRLPDVSFRYTPDRPVFNGQRMVIRPGGPITEFSRTGVNTSYDRFNFKQQAHEQDLFLKNFDYLSSELKVGMDSTENNNESLYAIVRVNYRANRARGDAHSANNNLDANNDYLTFGYWHYEHQSSSYEEIGAFVQGPEIDYTPPPGFDLVGTPMPTSGTATYYHPSGAGGMYVYDGREHQFEADVRLTARFGQETSTPNTIEGCVGCGKSLRIFEGDNLTKRQIDFRRANLTRGANAVVRARTAFDGEGASGRWDLKLSREPKTIKGQSVPRLTAGTFNAEWTGSEGDKKGQITGYFVAPLDDYNP